MVPGRGLEPPRRCQRQHLKLVRLPIPPSGHGVDDASAAISGSRAHLSTAIDHECPIGRYLKFRSCLSTHGAA